ncbi:MAG: lytic transglycosylase domain-containing protein [Clostridia bacterium]|nr:lytic transglycosylase domain-containing protein [Clostridia bacterium]
MNTPSPAPQRRRRNPQSAPPAQEQTQRAARRRAQPQASAGKSLDSLLEGSFLERIPSPVRLALIVLCAAIFLTGAVGITRSYLAQQEERRRLEAEAAERAQHPLEFADMIVTYSMAQNVDPALVSAVILCESSYNPLAESRLGARGLMQLMKDTAEWVAHKLDEDDADYSFDLLYDPETNIRFGTWYLGYLSRRFDGDATKIVCAYHAGQGNVDAWLKNPAYSRDGVTLDVIPTQDTATYASRVLRARDVYRKHYFPLPTPAPTQPQ